MGMFTVALGQARVEPRPGGARPAAAPAGAAAPTAANAQGSSDQQIAAVIHACARNEVEVSKLAQKQAKSDDVKEFAAMMVKDHSPQVDKMGRLAGNLVATQSGERIESRKVPAEGERREDARKDEGRKDETRREGREERREEGREERTTATGAQRPFNWVTIHHEIADQCLKSLKDEFSKKEGSEFDKCYMSQQVGAHMKTIDELKVFKNHASGQLQQEIEQGIETAEGHLKEAKQILEKLDGSKGSKSDRNEK